MHLHSFTYDFHVRVLSDRLSKLVQKQKTSKRINDDRHLAMLLEHRNSVQSNLTKPGDGRKKNSIAGFLDDFLKYYNEPPLYSSCLVLAGNINILNKFSCCYKFVFVNFFRCYKTYPNIC